MTTNHHTPITGGDDISTTVLNAVFSDLDSGISAISTPTVPMCRATNSANIAIPNGTATDLTFNTEDFDTDTMFTTADSAKITIKTAGKYMVGANATFTSNATGFRLIYLTLNTTDVIAATSTNAVNGLNSDLSVVGVYDLAVNDVLNVKVSQTSGGSLNVITYSSSPSFWAVKVS